MIAIPLMITGMVLFGLGYLLREWDFDGFGWFFTFLGVALFCYSWFQGAWFEGWFA